MGSRALRPRVLLIDDHEDTREMYAGYLASIGMDVRTAEDGETGVELALAWRPDIIVSDWSMPKMTGDEAMRRIKADERTRRIPIVILTAFGLQQRAQLEAAGAAAVCGKPCTPPELEKMIKGLLGLAPTAKVRRGTKRIQGPKRVGGAFVGLVRRSPTQ